MNTEHMIVRLEDGKKVLLLVKVVDADENA